MKKITIIISSIILVFALASIIFVVVYNNLNTIVSPESIELRELMKSEKTQIQFSGEKTVLVFFTSWCPYCNIDAPKIVTLYDKYKDSVNIYGINLIYRDDLSEVKEYVEKYNIKYPVLLDETGDLHKHFGDTGFPALFFINLEGEVVDQIIGSTDIETIEDSFKYLIEYY